MRDHDESMATMQRVDELLSHVWMVRTFLKHSEEVEDDPELQSVHRTLYDCMHALGTAYAECDSQKYLRILAKKLGKLKSAAQLLEELQPDVSTHTNFLMARRSLTSAIQEIARLA